MDFVKVVALGLRGGWSGNCVKYGNDIGILKNGNKFEHYEKKIFYRFVFLICYK